MTTLLFVPNAISEQTAKGITLSAVGDIMMGSDYLASSLPRNGGRELFKAAAPYFLTADISMANLEGPLLRGGTTEKQVITGKSYIFRSPPEYASLLKDAGIKMVSLANNHSHDFGRGGLLSTKRILEEHGVAFSSQDGEVAEFLIRGVRIGIISLSFGPPPRSILHAKAALDEINSLAERYDILVLSIHGGSEGRGALHASDRMEYFLDAPRGNLVRFAHDAIDLGADLVIGHGPHVPRALELYHGRLIAYSLGNFCTWRGINITGESGYAPLLQIELTDSGEFLRGRIVSFLQKPGRGPVIDKGKRAGRLMSGLTRSDFPKTRLVIDDDGTIATR